jgi:hypothetical protein
MRIAPALMIVAAMVATLAAGCAATPRTAAGSDPRHPSAALFAETLSRFFDTNFEPLHSPRDAIDQSNLIVRGVVAEVFDGIAVAYPDADTTARRTGLFVTLRVTVTEVLAGPPVGTVDVQVMKSPTTTVAELAAASANSGVIAILEDITRWVPAPGATVTRPSRMPSTAPIYGAFSDGLWLQDPGDATMTGVGLEPAELDVDWGDPRTLDELAARIRGA